MASLEGRSVASSYKDLLQVSNSNSGIDGTARVVSDGEDTASKLFLDTNRVGVGIAPTDGTLHVHTASAGSVDAPSVTDDLIVENNDHAGIQILSPDDKFGTLGFGSPADAIAGMVRYDETNKTMIFGTVEGTNAGNIKLVTANEVTALTIDSSQNVGIGTSSPKHYSGTSGTVLSIHDSSFRGILELSGASNSDGGVIGALTFANTENTAANGALAQLYTEVETSDSNAGDDSGGHLLFFTKPEAGTLAEAMRIASNGDVSIGTTANYGDLTVGGTGELIAGRASSGAGSFSMYEAGTTRFVIESLNGSNGVAFKTPSTARMILDDNSRISLSNNDGGNNNTTFGYQAGLNITTNGDENTLVGHASGVELTTGEHNVGVGHKSIFDFKEGSYNTAVGSFSLGGSHGSTADASAENVAIGYSAMGNNFDNSATTDQCVAIGAFAMNGALNNVDGTVAVGYKSLNALTSGGKNVVIGYESGKAVTTGQRNTVLGHQAFNITVDADECVAIGNYSMGGGVATADGTVAIGRSSLSALTIGSGNTAIGYKSLSAETVASQSTAIGFQALGSQVGGSGNVGNIGIGYQAGFAITSGTNNTVIGTSMDQGTCTGTHNTVVGRLVARTLTDGTRNTAVGWNSMSTVTTGDNNVCIGDQSDVSGADAQNQTVIGQNATGTGNNEVAIGNTSVTAIKAQVTSITAYSSDERTKKDIQDYDLKGLDFIKDLQLKTYIYKNPADFPDEIRNSKWDKEDVERPSDPTETQVGLIAQEVEEALKKHGIGNVETYAPTQESGIKTLTYGNLIFPLIKAVQELSAKVTELENK